MTEELPTPNLPLLRKTVEHIDAHPEEWDQSVWKGDIRQQLKWYQDYLKSMPSMTPMLQSDFTSKIKQLEAKLANSCNSVGCIAGWAVTFENEEKLETLSDGEVRIASGDPDYGFFEAAQKALGLTNEEAERLFSGSNTREEVQEVCERIAERAGEKF